MKKLDLNKSVYELTQEYPELIDIMKDLGFTDITNKVMLNSVGKITTIPKGARMRKIPMQKVVMTLILKGFQLTGKMPDLSKISDRDNAAEGVMKASNNTVELLKGYLKRLGDGEALESVRADFVANFEDVEASMIMRAEQEMMAEGTPLEEVQKLCDLHSALFHGATREEKIANAELEVEASLKRGEEKVSEAPQADYANKNELAAALVAVKGHPLYTFTRENEAFKKLLSDVEAMGGDVEKLKSALPAIRDIAIHYAKKGDLLYPHLKVKYDISGPSDVMWTVDDEIRDGLSALAKANISDENWVYKLKDILVRADEMIYKETNILFPICAVNFTDAEWKQIYKDSKDYADCFGVENTLWDAGEAYEVSLKGGVAGEVVMPGGHMSVEQLTALLNTIPLEITFVDADNINRYFNEGPKLFKRPGMAIDREVFSCHPPKIEPMVRSIIEDFRNGVRDSVPVWMEKNGQTMLVTYMAVRDSKNRYVGTAEFIQNMEFAKEYFGK